MVGTFVLYHESAEAPGQAALVVGVNDPELDADGQPLGARTLNLTVFPDQDAPPAPDVDAITTLEAGPGPSDWIGWLPVRVTDVGQDQPGKATDAYWSPLEA